MRLTGSLLLFYSFFQGQSPYGQNGDDSVSGTQSVADGIATQESVTQSSSTPTRPSADPEETSFDQTDVAGGITGGCAISTSTSALLNAAMATEGTQPEESSASSITLSVSTPVPLNGSASSSNAPAPLSATESASVFEVVLFYERSAHAQVFPLTAWSLMQLPLLTILKISTMINRLSDLHMTKRPPRGTLLSHLKPHRWSQLFWMWQVRHDGIHY